ncbi:MAG: M1 family peptidase, partial [Maribacter sp.]
MFSQKQDKVDFTHANVSISIDPITKEIIGNVVYEFEVQNKVDSVFLDAKNMVFKSIRLNGKKVKSRYDDKTIRIYKNFKKGRFYTISLSYSVKPTQTVYFLGFEDSIAGNEQVWTQGQG